MNKFLNKLKYFSVGEWVLLVLSELFIIISFVVFHGDDYFTFFSSMLGVISLLFIAKGNPFGQILMIIFASAYGIVAFSFGYYGETITYLCFSAPMALISLIAWLRNPYKGNKAQVKISDLTAGKVLGIFAFATVFTVVGYFILKLLGTANILPSTLSLFTSAVAVGFSALRSPFFALSYAVNDVVLIVLWSMAVKEDVSYLSVVICFTAFLANDLYSFFNWLRIKRKQREN